MRRHNANRRGRLRATVLLLLSLRVLAACRNDPPVRTLASAGSPVVSAWDSLFGDERELHLQVPSTGRPLLAIRRLAIGTHGTMFVPDRERILAFAPDGTLARELSGGRDLPLSITGALGVDPDGNLFVYDPDGDWITELAKPAFKVVRRFQLKRRVAANEIAPLADGSLVTYDPSDEDGAFTRFDNTGRDVATIYPIRDDRLRIFQGRVRGGGMVRDSAGDVFGILPSTFELVHLSDNLRLLELLRRPPGNPLASDSRPFPARLDPYDYRPKHATWWDTFTHIGPLFALEPDVLLVVVFNSHGIGQAHEFIDVYRTDGRIVAEGLQVPHDGHIVAAGGGKVFVARNGRLVANDSISKLALYSYQLREMHRTIAGGSLSR
jgi:hypothetical protein